MLLIIRLSAFFVYRGAALAAWGILRFAKRSRRIHAACGILRPATSRRMTRLTAKRRMTRGLMVTEPVEVTLISQQPHRSHYSLIENLKKIP